MNDQRLRIRVTETEVRALEKSASKRGLPVSEYVRECVPELQEGRKRGRPPKPSVDNPTAPGRSPARRDG